MSLLRKILFLVLMLCFATYSHALLEGKTFSGDNVQISEPAANNIYASGGEVRVLSDVAGDVIIAGGQLRISGNVQGDIAAAGGQIDISSQNVQDIRSAGGRINVSSQVGNDLVLAGGNILVSDAAVIGQDAILTGGDIVIEGDVTGDLLASGGRVTILGTIGGNATINSDNIILGDDARINGNLAVPSEATVDAAKVGGTITRLPGRDVWRPLDFAARFFGGIATGIMLYLVGAALILLARGFLDRAYHEAGEHLWLSLFFGLMILVGTPIAIILFFITLIGIPLALTLLGLYIISILLGIAVGTYLLGRLVYDRIFKAEASGYLSLLVGVVLYVVIGWIPVIGGLFGFLLLLLGLGAAIRALFSGRKRK